MAEPCPSGRCRALLRAGRGVGNALCQHDQRQTSG